MFALWLGEAEGEEGGTAVRGAQTRHGLRPGEGSAGLQGLAEASELTRTQTVCWVP